MDACNPPLSPTADARCPDLFRQRLAEAPSATLMLQAWCEARGIGDGPVRIRRRPGPASALPAGSGALLLAGDPAPGVGHRRVSLLRGAARLSDCDIWWVPSRLPEEMQAALDATDRPFGSVVAPLRPVRRILSETLPPPGGVHWLEVEALVVAGTRPIALAREAYRRILAE